MKWQGRELIDRSLNPDAVLFEYGHEIMSDPRYRPLASFIQHHGSNTMRHCIFVARGCIRYAQKHKIKVDVRSLVRGALLHDYYLYEWRTSKPKGHAHHHGEWAMENAMIAFGLNELEKNMIFCHMWPMRFFNWPKSREAFILCLQDKVVAISEVFESKKKKAKREGI